MTERKAHDDDVAYLGPVTIAQFIEMGWMKSWPLTITKGGFRAARNGFGRDKLPLPTEPGSTGGMFWEGRRAAPAR